MIGSMLLIHEQLDFFSSRPFSTCQEPFHLSVNPQKCESILQMSHALLFSFLFKAQVSVHHSSPRSPLHSHCSRYPKCRTSQKSSDPRSHTTATFPASSACPQSISRPSQAAPRTSGNQSPTHSPWPHPTSDRAVKCAGRKWR